MHIEQYRGKGMELFEAIHSRKSVGAVKASPISRETIEKLLAAGSAAPNHFKLRPWVFTVLQGEELVKFGEAHVQSLLKKNPAATPELIEIERKKGVRTPLVISVASQNPVEPKEKDVENISAAAAACQNILLAAHAMGLAVVWRTALYASDDTIKEFLGVSENQHLIGVLCIGEAENYDTSIPERPSYIDRVIWR